MTHSAAATPSLPSHLNPETIHVSNHPLILDRLGRMRDKACNTEEFRRNMEQISYMLAYEACMHLQTADREITTPLTGTTVRRLKRLPPVIVPILRAGLGLTKGFEYLMPECVVGHIGMYRDEDTKRPVDYLLRLPKNMDRPVFLLDPMLATGHSSLRAAEILIEKGAKESDITCVFLIAAPEGLALFQNRFPNMHIHVAAVDSHLNEHAFIVPGLGDAGDRLLGTD